jgi:UDP-N-acetylmuramate dehydrogenase
MSQSSPTDNPNLDTLYEALAASPHTMVTRDVVLAPYTTWKIGGPADLFIEVSDAAATATVLSLLANHGVDWVVLGNGSNVLVADDGYRGAVIWLGGELSGVTLTRDAFGQGRHRVDAGAGLSLTRLLRLAKDENLSGLWVLGGIPGTVGGAVRMNAGTRWGEVKDTLHAVQVATRDGLVELGASELGLGYRHSQLPFGAIVTRATFAVRDADASMKKKLDEVLSHRKSTQPLQHPSCGSVFANPPGDSAGRLIEAVGLKGHREGDLEFSDQHANWIINTGRGTAKDALALINLAQKRVADAFSILLRPEVIRIGDLEPRDLDSEVGGSV